MAGAAEFPLVDRELIRAGRDVHTYLGRAYLAVIAIVIMGLFWWGNEHYELKLLESGPERISTYFAGLALFFQYMIVLLVGPGLTVPLIIREKEERTLPLLLLTGRRHWDVIAAKYVSVLIQVVMLILAILPLQAIAAIFGGVDVAGLALQSALMILLASAVCALALCYSTVCKTTTAAISLVYFTLVAWFVVTFFLDRALTFAGILIATNLFVSIPWVAFYGSLGSVYYPAIALTALISVWAFARAVYFLPRQVLNAPTAKAHAPRRRGVRWTTHNGLYRLIVGGADGLGMSDRSPTIRVLAFLGLCGIAQAPVWGWLIVIVTYMWATTRGFGRLRASGGLEEILLTPQSERAIVRSLILSALSRGGFFAIPILLTFTVEPFLLGYNYRLDMLDMERTAFWSLLGLLVLQFVVCSTISAYALTISRPLKSLERYANLVYIIAVIFPFLLPYLGMAILVTIRRDYYGEWPWMYLSWQFAAIWGAIVSTVAGVMAYSRAVRRIRSRVLAGPPATRDHPLLALLRP